MPKQNESLPTPPGADDKGKEDQKLPSLPSPPSAVNSDVGNHTVNDAVASPVVTGPTAPANEGTASAPANSAAASASSTVHPLAGPTPAHSDMKNPPTGTSDVARPPRAPADDLLWFRGTERTGTRLGHSVSIRTVEMSSANRSVFTETTDGAMREVAVVATNFPSQMDSGEDKAIDHPSQDASSTGDSRVAGCATPEAYPPTLRQAPAEDVHSKGRLKRKSARPTSGNVGAWPEEVPIEDPHDRQGLEDQISGLRTRKRMRNRATGGSIVDKNAARNRGVGSPASSAETQNAPDTFDDEPTQDLFSTALDVETVADTQEETPPDGPFATRPGAYLIEGQNLESHQPESPLDENQAADDGEESSRIMVPNATIVVDEPVRAEILNFSEVHEDNQSQKDQKKERHLLLLILAVVLIVAVTLGVLGGTGSFDNPAASTPALESPADQPAPVLTPVPSNPPTASLPPISHPSDLPSWLPTNSPTDPPSQTPSLRPLLTPTSHPSDLPTPVPTSSPSGTPSLHPTHFTWTQLGSNVDGAAPGDESGSSVGISASGDRLIIGAPLSDSHGNGSGEARALTLRRTGNQALDWELNDDSIFFGDAENEKAGHSVSISSDGNVVAVGIPGGDGLSGLVRVYNATTESDLTINWRQLGNDIAYAGPSDRSGWSVSLSPDGWHVAVGMRNVHHEQNGFVNIYRYNPSNQRWEGNTSDSPSGGLSHYWFGHSVSLASYRGGLRLAIGAIYGVNSGPATGRVQVYVKKGNSPRRLGQPFGGDSGDISGYSSVSFSADGNRVAVGPRKPDSGSSSQSAFVQVFEYMESEEEWVQIGGRFDEALTDSALSLSDDGTFLAVGASLRKTEAGVQSGVVRIYEYVVPFGTSSGFWKKVGDDIEGEALGDRFGQSVSLSADGSRVAIGAPNHDGNGIDSGRTQVFHFSSQLSQ